jgi:subtilisin family serine protease
VVCAAGNEGEFGPGGILSPGNDPFVITVGSSDTRQTADRRDDVVTYYSSIGPTLFDRFAKPDLVAPGNKIVSLRTPGSYIDEHFPENTLPLSSYAAREAGDGASGYVVLSGTSTSAPLVAGAAALMLSEDRTLSPDDVKLRLMRTADPLHGVGAEQQGAGVLDVATALRDDARAGGYALSTQVGEGKRAFTPGDYTKWQTQTWSKYGWTQFKATKFKWTKFKWTELAWTKFKWTKFKWTQMEWAKFKWTVLLQGQ